MLIKLHIRSLIIAIVKTSTNVFVIMSAIVFNIGLRVLFDRGNLGDDLERL